MRWLWLALFTVPALGCGEPPEVLATRARMQAQTAALAAELDGLEARLTEDAARVRFYTVLAERHRHVSALACQNAEMHATSMRRLEAREQARMHALRSLARADDAVEDAR